MAVSLLSVARVAGLLAVLLLACGGAVAQVVITVSSWLPPAHALSEAQRDWCALLDRKTAGKARCNVLTRAVSAPAGPAST